MGWQGRKREVVVFVVEEGGKVEGESWQREGGGGELQVVGYKWIY